MFVFRLLVTIVTILSCSCFPPGKGDKQTHVSQFNFMEIAQAKCGREAQIDFLQMCSTALPSDMLCSLLLDYTEQLCTQSFNFSHLTTDVIKCPITDLVNSVDTKTTVNALANVTTCEKLCEHDNSKKCSIIHQLSTAISSRIDKKNKNVGSDVIQEKNIPLKKPNQPPSVVAPKAVSKAIPTEEELIKQGSNVDPPVNPNVPNNNNKEAQNPLPQPVDNTKTLATNVDATKKVGVPQISKTTSVQSQDSTVKNSPVVEQSQPEKDQVNAQPPDNLVPEPVEEVGKEDLGQGKESFDYMGQGKEKVEDLEQGKEKIEDLGQGKENVEGLGQGKENIDGSEPDKENVDNLGQGKGDDGNIGLDYQETEVEPPEPEEPAENEGKPLVPHPKIETGQNDEFQPPEALPKQITTGPFVEAEDSHFFAYFLTFTCFTVMGYIAFHNKNKILALLLEGRRGRPSRRRPNSASYRKLDSLEEAMMAHPSHASTTHVIY